MELYLVELRCGWDYEGDSYEILGVFDSMSKAEALIEEYLHSDDYKETEHDFDYVNVDIINYNLNKKHRDF